MISVATERYRQPCRSSADFSRRNGGAILPSAPVSFRRRIGCPSSGAIFSAGSHTKKPTSSCPPSGEWNDNFDWPCRPGRRLHGGDRGWFTHRHKTIDHRVRQRSIDLLLSQDSCAWRAAQRAPRAASGSGNPPTSTLAATAPPARGSRANCQCRGAGVLS